VLSCLRSTSPSIDNNMLEQRLKEPFVSIDIFSKANNRFSAKNSFSNFAIELTALQTHPSNEAGLEPRHPYALPPVAFPAFRMSLKEGRLHLFPAQTTLATAANPVPMIRSFEKQSRMGCEKESPD
jgi:hypothetical protein